MITLGFNLRLRMGDLEGGLLELEESFKEITSKSMRENVDAGFSYSMLEQGGMLESPDKWTGYLRGPSTANKKLVDEISHLYVKAWEARYENLRKEFEDKRKEHPASQKWVKWKKKHSGQPSPWNGLPIMSNPTFGIMTGFLKRSVSAVFAGSVETSYMKIDNLALRGIWRHNVDGYNTRTPYISRITEYYARELDILSDESELTKLDSGALSEIGTKMLSLMQSSFIQPLVRDLRQLEIEIEPPSSDG